MDVRLRADAVVFVLGDPAVVAQLAVRRSEGERRGQHEADRLSVGDRKRTQSPLTGGERNFADVGRRHRRAADIGRGHVEGRRDRVKQQSLTQADAQFAEQNFRDVSDFAPIATGPENALARQFPTSSRGLARCRGELV